MRHSAIWIVVIAILAAAPATAADMYRWVDDQGRTNISDAVPERYRARATRIDSRQFEPSERQRAEALALGAALRARAASSASQPSATPPAALKASGSPSPVPATAPAASDCETLLRQYAQAQSCFAPCQQSNGSVKAECFSRCPNVPDPSRQCGLPRLQ